MKEATAIGLAITIFTAAGCSVAPATYSIDDRPPLHPRTSTSRLVSELTVSEVAYAPALPLSQFDVSTVSCLPCKSDGSTKALSYVQPVAEIVQSELRKALADVGSASRRSACNLKATVHLASVDSHGFGGGPLLDITYRLVNGDKAIYQSRVVASGSVRIFKGGGFERQFEEAAQASIEQLLARSELRQLLESGTCSPVRAS